MWLTSFCAHKIYLFIFKTAYAHDRIYGRLLAVCLCVCAQRSGEKCRRLFGISMQAYLCECVNDCVARCAVGEPAAHIHTQTHSSSGAIWKRLRAWSPHVLLTRTQKMCDFTCTYNTHKQTHTQTHTKRNTWLRVPGAQVCVAQVHLINSIILCLQRRDDVCRGAFMLCMCSTRVLCKRRNRAYNHHGFPRSTKVPGVVCMHVSLFGAIYPKC